MKRNCFVVKHKGGNTRRGRVLSLLFGAWHAYKPLICLAFAVYRVGVYSSLNPRFHSLPACYNIPEKLRASE